MLVILMFTVASYILVAQSEIIIRMIYPNTDKEGTKWSRVIPLAAAGSAGTFKLEQDDRSYEVIILLCTG